MTLHQKKLPDTFVSGSMGILDCWKYKDLLIIFIIKNQKNGST